MSCCFLFFFFLLCLIFPQHSCLLELVSKEFFRITALILFTSQAVTGESKENRFVYLSILCKGIHMDVKPESWRRQPMPQSLSGQNGTSHMAWRSSGDESSWNRSPCAARPHSCIEGRLKDEWLQTLHDLQTCSIQQQLPPYLQKNDTSQSVSPSLVASSRSSLESLYSGPENKERVQIKTGPSTQRAKVCCIAPVRVGWLPLQRHVVRKERPDNAAQQDGTTCKVRAKLTGLMMIHESLKINVCAF